MSDARPRALGAALAAGALALGLATSITVPAAADPDIEAALLRLVNAEREAAGVPTLTEDTALSADAGAWSEQLAADGTLAHATFEVVDATSWGENVGYTSAEDAAARLHELLMASPEHQANILDPSWTVVGIGVTMVDGTVWMTQRFADTAVTTTDVPVVETITPVAAPEAPAALPAAETEADVADDPAPEPSPAAAQDPPSTAAPQPQSAPAAPAAAAPAPAAAPQRSSAPASSGQPPVATVNPGRSGSTPAAEHRRGPTEEPGSQGRTHGRP